MNISTSATTVTANISEPVVTGTAFGPCMRATYRHTGDRSETRYVVFPHPPTPRDAA